MSTCKEQPANISEPIDTISSSVSTLLQPADENAFGFEPPIQIISSAIVTPRNSSKYPSIIQRIELTPLDLPFLMVDYIHRGILFLKPAAKVLQAQKELGNQEIIHHLKTSLSLALDIFTPFAGRLAAVENEDNTTSFFLDCNGAGAQFVHAVSAHHGLTVADVLEPLYVPSNIVHSFFSMNGVYNCEGISKPLLAVQVTELVDGIFIGFTYNHAISDGTSFWHFVNTWSEISRSPPPDHHEDALQLNMSRPVKPYWFLDGVDHPVRVCDFSYHETISTRPVLPPLLERVFHFSKEKIAALKAKASAEISTSSECNYISSLQAILGHLWRSIIRNRYLDPDQEIHCRVLVNLRQRFQPPLPENYFGNVVYFGTASTTVGELLLDHGLGRAALLINKMVALQTNGEARKKLESLGRRPKLHKLSATSSNALIVASSPRFNVYGNDFGWGRPIAVRGGAGNNYDGKITVFPGVDEGSVDIQACLTTQTLQAMPNDEEFMEAISK